VKTLKKTLLRIFFAFETVVFSFVYLFGAQGITAMRQLEREHAKLQLTMVQLESEVTVRTARLASLKNDSFYLEKIARENLHMARKNELIFVDQ
jgi:cell division protein FtsB